MGNMEHTRCFIGESDMKGFTTWWESSLPAYMIMYCIEGEAVLKLQFKNHDFRKGMMTIIPPDMFPAFVSRSETFCAFYWLMDRDSAEKALYEIPNGFYETIYVAPVLPVGDGIDHWMTLLRGMSDDNGSPYRHRILSDVMHAFVLDYYDRWQRHYGDLPLDDRKSPAEAICMRFYNLIFDHFREHRNIAYYAEKLCITPNYLAMIVRQICNETPKQAIDRYVILEMKYMLRNTTLTAEQIAMQMNFPDASYMHRFFRRHTGLSLSEYRKNII